MKQPQRNKTRRDLRANRRAEKYRYWEREARFCTDYETRHLPASRNDQERMALLHAGYLRNG